MATYTLEQFEAHGYTLAATLYANVGISLVVVGIQCFICFYTLSVFLGTPRKLRKGRLAYIILSFVIFGLCTLAAVLDMYYVFTVFGRSRGWGDLLPIVVQDWKEGLWVRKLSFYSIIVWILIGDGILLYRCFIIWSNRWWVVIPPTILYLSSFGTAVAVDVLAYRDNNKPSGNADVAHAVLSTATNVVITSLILARLLQATRDVRKAFPDGSCNMYKGIMTILVESALPLAFLGVIYAAVLLSSTRSHSFETTVALDGASRVLSYTFYYFFALSPQLIIFKVITGSSWKGSSDATPPALTRSLAFAHRSGLDLDSNVVSVGTGGTDDTQRVDSLHGSGLNLHEKKDKYHDLSA